MRKLFITSDVHSFFTPLRRALGDKGFEADNPEHFLLVSGDLFDRGKESKELLEFVQRLGDRFLYVRGNHEDLLFDCCYQVEVGMGVNVSHYTNGTLDTVSQLTRYSTAELIAPFRSETLMQEVKNKMDPILKRIDDKSFNYIEVGNNIFVHGWIPTLSEDPFVHYSKRKFLFQEDWNEPYPDESNITAVIRHQNMWDSARWVNGMEAWRQGIRLPDKTIYCGHYHCSYGWAHIDQARKEFPSPNRKDWLKSFEIWRKDGIVALDACTAFTGLINCDVIEIEDEVEIKCMN